jgi:hypothetical protein
MQRIVLVVFMQCTVGLLAGSISIMPQVPYVRSKEQYREPDERRVVTFQRGYILAMGAGNSGEPQAFRLQALRWSLEGPCLKVCKSMCVSVVLRGPVRRGVGQRAEKFPKQALALEMLAVLIE